MGEGARVPCSTTARDRDATTDIWLIQPLSTQRDRGEWNRLDLTGHGVDVGRSVHARVGGDRRDLVEVR